MQNPLGAPGAPQFFHISVSAGHSLKDPGACTPGLTESEVNRILRDRVVKHMRNAGHLVSAPEDTLDLNGTVRDLRNKGTVRPFDLVVELHMNAAGPHAEGIECFYANGNAEMRIFGTQVMTSVSKLSGLKNRGAKPEAQSHRGRLGFLRLPRSLLIEMGFLTNPEDVRRVLDPEFARWLSESILMTLQQEARRP